MRIDLEKAIYARFHADALLLKVFEAADCEAFLCFEVVHDLVGGTKSDLLKVSFKDVHELRTGAIEVSARWPLDVIGFDAIALHDSWEFVLHCDTLEWTWRSTWPAAWNDLQPIS